MSTYFAIAKNYCFTRGLQFSPYVGKLMDVEFVYSAFYFSVALNIATQSPLFDETTRSLSILNSLKVAEEGSASDYLMRL